MSDERRAMSCKTNPKRRYEEVFVKKLTDCLGEEFEMETLLNCPLD